MSNVLSEKLVSVVVPVYNVEPYLEQCLDSIVSQTYYNIEVILVNDGSTDDSLSICQRYVDADSRFSVISQHNQGLSAARNTGIAAATGFYVTFVDSDDWLEPQYVAQLVALADENNAEVSVVSYFYETFTDDSSHVPFTKVRYDDKAFFSFDSSEALRQLCRDRLLQNFAWAKLYRLSLFRDYDIHYPVGKIFEDMYTTTELLSHVSRMVILNVPLYHYRRRMGSIVSVKVWDTRYGFISAKLHQARLCLEKGAFNKMPRSYMRHALHFLNQYNRLEHTPLTASYIREVAQSFKLYDGQGLFDIGPVYVVYRWLVIRNINLYLRLSRYNDILFVHVPTLPFEPV